MVKIKVLKVYKNPLGLPIEQITDLTEEEMNESNEEINRQLFDISGKSKPIEYAYPVKEIRVRDSIYEPLLTFI